METRICQNCGQEFNVTTQQIKKSPCIYCSRRCNAISANRAMVAATKTRITKFCVICSKQLEIKKSHAKREGTYCSYECRAIGYSKTYAKNSNPNWKNKLFLISCRHCGKSFEVRECMHRKFCSRSCSALSRIVSGGNVYSRTKSGKRADLNNRFFRSAWEANWARYLNWLKSNGEIQSWEYESETFEFSKIKRGSRFYIIDFKVKSGDGSIEYHEVKGFMDAKSETKLKRMARFYPNIKIILIDKHAYSDIENKFSHLLPNWE